MISNKKVESSSKRKNCKEWRRESEYAAATCWCYAAESTVRR